MIQEKVGIKARFKAVAERSMAFTTRDVKQNRSREMQSWNVQRTFFKQSSVEF